MDPLNTKIKGVGKMKSMKHTGLISTIFSLIPETLLADQIDVYLYSNFTWKSFDHYVADWEKRSFDDSGWNQARENYPTPGWTANQLIPGTQALTIWHDPAGTSNGTTGVNEAFFRTTFHLDIDEESIPLLATAIMYVDDDFELYVNGKRAYTDHSGGGADERHTVDFSTFLLNGENTLAIHAVDGSWDRP